jgi:hypothetical protein
MHRQLKIPIDRQHIIGHNEVPHPYIAGGYGGQPIIYTVQATTGGEILYMSYVNQYASGQQCTSGE